MSVMIDPSKYPHDPFLIILFAFHLAEDFDCKGYPSNYIVNVDRTLIMILQNP